MHCLLPQEMCGALGAVMGRPSWLPVPEFAIQVRPWSPAVFAREATSRVKQWWRTSSEKRISCPIDLAKALLGEGAKVVVEGQQARAAAAASSSFFFLGLGLHPADIDASPFAAAACRCSRPGSHPRGSSSSTETSQRRSGA